MASAVPELPVLARDQAFETLYRRYVKDVYRYALALLRNPADAEDVTQTTFMNAYRAYKRGDEILKPQNWLIKIAHNVARTRYARASRRVKEVPLEDHVEQLAVPEEDRPNIEGVLHALGRLPFNQRAALVMRELEGRSYAEIAETLGVSVAAVETLIFRGRRSLRLKASALRVLTAVPLPSSLAQLFEGGAVAAGGGAIAGIGFLAKAAVVLVAGALATGFSGDKTSPATAASESGARLTAVPVGGNTLTAGGPRTSSQQSAKKAARQGVRQGRAGTATGSRPILEVEVGKATRSSTQPASSPPAGNSPAPAAPTAPAPTEQVAATASSVVSSVEETVGAVVDALPVEVPSLPPVPLEPPPPPPLPKLP
jgi:RNA polymerase sigma factor (sigma-70 family)